MAESTNSILFQYRLNLDQSQSQLEIFLRGEQIATNPLRGRWNQARWLLTEMNSCLDAAQMQTFLRGILGFGFIGSASGS